MRCVVVFLRFKVRHIVKSQGFYWLIIVLVFLNTVFVAIEHYGQDKYLNDFLCKPNLDKANRYFLHVVFCCCPSYITIITVITIQYLYRFLPKIGY